jgi:lysophospholipase L1-like esterase
VKTILAYGDSLTFGADAETQGRHAYQDRWPSVLEDGLSGRARVIAEGLGGRTTVFDDFAAAADRNGARVLPTLLASHSPLDLVILFLGTNDLKTYINGTAFGAAMGIKRLVEIIRTHPYGTGSGVPDIIVVAPPLTVPTDHVDLNPMFAPRAEEAFLFSGYYGRIAAELHCAFFDAATVATATPIDGVHLDAKNTRAIGEGLVPVVKSVLGF